MAKVTNTLWMMLPAAGLAASLALVGCGGASGGTRGTGGATGTGGSSGNTGLGGMQVTGAGGAAVVVPLDCAAGVDPSAPLLTDFSPTSWSNGSGKWTSAGGDLTGSKYSAGGANSASSITNSIDTTLVDPNYHIQGTVAAGDYGFALLSFDKCVNTHTYTGIQFTIGGTTGGCDMYFKLQTFDQQGAANHGGCPTGSSCYNFPTKKFDVPATPMPVTVYFSELAMAPATADQLRAQIVGLQWQLQSPAPPVDASQITCTGIDFTIDNVGFATGTPP